MESIIRRFRNLAFMLMIMPLAILSAFLVGLAVSPGFFIVLKVYYGTKDQSFWFHVISMISAFGLGFLAFILTLIFAVPAANFLLPLTFKHLRGLAYSL